MFPAGKIDKSVLKLVHIRASLNSMAGLRFVGPLRDDDIKGRGISLWWL